MFHLDFNGTNFGNDGTLRSRVEGAIRTWESVWGKGQDAEHVLLLTVIIRGKLLPLYPPLIS